ncbi:MAG: GNAT family N-acetyltransferase [Bacteroidetes bacterium]|nr:GNAT family N-acetyltransferase [Bacteroidota bacterium]
MEIVIRKLSTVAEMLPNYYLITQLSPQLTVEAYRSMLPEMVPNNYYQAAAYDGDHCIGVSGYWICTKLYSGKYIEIDNFVVDEHWRSAGVGKLLLNWLLDEGRRNGCRTAMLDAYVENFKAHHFYYREGFIARGFHYLKPLL